MKMYLRTKIVSRVRRRQDHRAFFTKIWRSHISSLNGPTHNNLMQSGMNTNTTERSTNPDPVETSWFTTVLNLLLQFLSYHIIPMGPNIPITVPKTKTHDLVHTAHITSRSSHRTHITHTQQKSDHGHDNLSHTHLH